MEKPSGPAEQLQAGEKLEADWKAEASKESVQKLSGLRWQVVQREQAALGEWQLADQQKSSKASWWPATATSPEAS